MTERPEGAPDADPATTEELDAELEAVTTATEAIEAADNEIADGFEDEPFVPIGVEPGVEPDAPPVAATGATVPRRRGAPAPSVQRAPTQSELAVRVTDNSSRFFVIATVIVFVAIIGFGMLAGNGGLLTSTPAPTAVPSVSVGPSGSAGASAAPSESAVSASPS